jgi:para-nitrobenzyl esterase
MSMRFAAALLLALPALADAVQTSTGALNGATARDSQVRVFKGIPYAAPPVGPMRWKPPQDPAAWQGSREAKQFANECMQLPYPQSSLYYRPPQLMSEDCLYLNVWTGAKDATEKRPVMVWIHGGAYTRGSGSTPTYDGENFAAKGVVLVTVNYRLGVFGFLSHPELTRESDVKSSGNYGLLDMVKALEWVKKNIAAFGGDPDKVTIFGESAGSSAVNFLMASPLAKGLFHRAIGQSGANFGRTATLAANEREGLKVGESLAVLRGKPAAELIKAPGIHRPAIDGWFLPEDVSAIFAKGKHSDVPLLAGYNADEGTTLAPWTGNAQYFSGMIEQRYGAYADELLRLYPAGSDDQAAKSYYASFRDQGMGWQMRTWARAAAKSGKSPAYLYYFTRVPPGFEKYGAFHAAEIQYVFGNLSPQRQWEEADRDLTKAMTAYWVNFAAAGDPNGKGLPAWPKYDPKKDESMIFGESLEVKSGVNKRALDLFDRMAVTAAR